MLIGHNDVYLATTLFFPTFSHTYFRSRRLHFRSSIYFFLYSFHLFIQDAVKCERQNATLFSSTHADFSWGCATRRIYIKIQQPLDEVSSLPHTKRIPMGNKQRTELNTHCRRAENIEFEVCGCSEGYLGGWEVYCSDSEYWKQILNALCRQWRKSICGGGGWWKLHLNILSETIIEHNRRIGIFLKPSHKTNVIVGVCFRFVSRYYIRIYAISFTATATFVYMHMSSCYFAWCSVDKRICLHQGMCTRGHIPS